MSEESELSRDPSVRSESPRAASIDAASNETKLREFARWVIRESCFEAFDLDGSLVQDKAFELGLLVRELYDPVKYGASNGDAEPGDDWFTFAPWLRVSEPSPGDAP